MPAPTIMQNADALLEAVEKLGLVGGCAALGITPTGLDYQRKKDPAFAKCIKEAIARRRVQGYGTAASRSRSKHTAADWDAFLEILKTTPAGVATRRRGLPTRRTVNAKRRADPEFDRRYQEVVGSRDFERTKIVGRDGARIRKAPGEMDKVWAQVLTQLALNPYSRISSLPGMPTHQSFMKKRRRDAAFDEAAAAILESRSFMGRPPLVPTAAQIDDFLAAAREIGVIRACARPDSPSWGWTYRKSVSDPAFAERLTAACGARRRQILQRAAEERKAKAARRARDQPPIGEVLSRQLRQNDLYRLAAAAASSAARYLQGDARDDLIADLVLGVLNGEYGPDDMKAQARKYQTAYYGALRDTSSMDVSRSAEDKRTLHDALGSWDYG